MKLTAKWSNGVLVWLTGLSGSGKTTIAEALHSHLQSIGVRSFVIDGDKMREGISHDLGFSEADRRENIRRIGHIGKLFLEAGILPIVASIAPYRADRDKVRELLGEDRFFEVYVKCPIEVCEHRDPKQLYQKVRAGVIQQFTGIHHPYEEPLHPALVVETHRVDVASAVAMIRRALFESNSAEGGEPSGLA
ncbi:adenylyl-sulfate kinase [Alicyclobacillus fastidiosus]|uniref:Adenylyl-sulfate kinase n=1 Tax=Alicyclobacillus fastidiosus TaxID=392011 RepID=A0ABV5AGB0_9BACL|nr:adenylyl-sulfate kinase [Alicyclobacillus fastidiosus]WEH08888.1 adenylyl-sulfate kinase [Alicyclobacillus fastidiosus]